MVHKEDRKAVEEQAARTLSGVKVPALEHRIIRKDGATRWVKNTPVLNFDSQGGPLSCDGLVQDITERKRAEEALRESQERYKQLWNDAPVAYHTLDATGMVLQVNQTEMEMLGYTTDEMVGKPIFAFILPEQRKEAEERFRLKLAGMHLPKQEDRIYVRKDSSKIYVSIDDRLEHDTDGRVVGVRTTMVDVSEQKQAEEALQESEKKYSTLVENSLTGIYIDQDEQIVFANKRFAEIYRYSRDELMGMDSCKLVHPEDRPLTDRMRKRRLGGEDVPSEYQARGLTRDGETIWVNRRNTRIDYQGRPAILGNIVDITEQKRAEEKLRKINEELKSFVHVVSHDLKTPIIAIQGFSARLLKRYEQELGERGRRYMSQIETSAHRMEALVSDLLTLSTIGQIVSAFTDVSSLEIVRNVTSGLRAPMKDRGIELSIAESLPMINADAERIYQVFENLIVNAIKYMKDTKNPKIEIGYEDRGAFHQFHVRDKGIGIDPRYHQKIFEMFQRLKEIEDEQGTGLGLAIVERIVNNHGGQIWVESEKGNGATFYFTLPKKAS
jgi:PAS domain S-box-containing protein